MGCPFCDRKSIEDRIIAESRNFLFIGSIGQLVEGYSLIIPKKHVRCFGMMAPGYLERYFEFKEIVEKAMTKAYQKPIYFEHGIVGQSVKHAHIHCVPTGADLLPRLVRFHNRKIGSERELPAVLEDFGAYWFYEQRGQYVFDVTRDLKFYEPNMFEMALRNALAEELGFPYAANWRNVNQEEDKKIRQRAVEKLKEALK